MAKKTMPRVRGSDLIAFWAEWPVGDDVYIEECPFDMGADGVLYLADDRGNPTTVPVEPDQEYPFDYGCFGWQGHGPEPKGFNDDFRAVFRKWVKARSLATVTVDVPKDKLDDFKALMAERGWKVTS